MTLRCVIAALDTLSAETHALAHARVHTCSFALSKHRTEYTENPPSAWIYT